MARENNQSVGDLKTILSLNKDHNDWVIWWREKSTPQERTNIIYMLRHFGFTVDFPKDGSWGF